MLLELLPRVWKWAIVWETAGLEVWFGMKDGKLFAERETVMIAALAKLFNQFILDVVGILFGWVEGIF